MQSSSMHGSECMFTVDGMLVDIISLKDSASKEYKSTVPLDSIRT